MASEGGGKIKNRRGHSSSKPYERRKSLLSRITDSIKEVLRPSWLAADDSQTTSVKDRPLASPLSEQEEEFVSPVQSPSQLPGHLRLGLSSGDTPGSTVHHGDASQVPGGSSLQWLQRTQVTSTTWENRSRTAKSTWGNSASTFDKSQISRNFFAQRHSGNKPAETAGETSSWGLGGMGPDSDPSPSFSAASARDRLGRSEASSSSSAFPMSETNMDSGPHSRLEQTLERGADSMLVSPSVSSSPAESAVEDRPSKRLRLWSPQNLKKRQSQQSPALQPAFKISVFSSPRLNESVHESSFYSGKTTYGGASAYRRTSLSSSLPYQNALPLRKSVTAKPLNNSGNAVLSSSANQILKTLERLSDTKRSRISDTDTESLLSFTPTSYRKPSRPLQTTLPSRSLEMPVRGPPTQHRQSPVAASIARNRQVVSLPSQRRQPSATATMSAAQRVEEEEDSRDISIHEEDMGEEYAEPTVSRSSGKMKHQKSYDTRGRSRKQSREGDDVADIPNLRTDFTLPISSMPAFNLGFPAFTNSPQSAVSAAASSSSKTNSGIISQSKTTSAGTSVISAQSPPKLQFTFSSPIHKSAPGPTQPSSSPVADFRFSSPLKVTDSMSGDNQPPAAVAGFSFTSSVHNTVPAWGSTEARPKSGNSSSSPSGGFGPSTSSMKFGSSVDSPSASSTAAPSGSLMVASALKSGSVMDILGKSPVMSSPPAFSAAKGLKQGSVMDVLGGKNDGKLGSPSVTGFMPAAQLKQGSVMDILGKKSPAASSSGSDNLLAKFAPPAGSWECEVCMVRNTSDISKCQACQSAKPGLQTTEPTTSKSSGSSSDNLFAKFAPPAGSWECESCMVQNSPSLDKCAACQTPRVAPSASAAPKPSTSGGDSLFARFSTPAGSWECDACMLQNKAEATKCVACETKRPGAATSAPKPSTSGGDSLFARFSTPAGSWECDACMVQNKAEATKCVACETKRPGAASSQSSSSPSGAPDNVMAKFKRPTGSWECDVCLVQNTGAHTKCVACESPRLGAMSAGTAPPSAPAAPAAQLAPGGGLTFSIPSSTSSAPSPFLAATSSTSQTSAPGGFKFVPPTSSSSSSASASSTFGGVQLGSSSEQKASSSSAGGFTFGQQNSSNSASTQPSSGFSFGAKDSSAVSVSAGSGLTAVSTSNSGFQFGIPSASSVTSSGGGFVFGSSVSSGSTTTTSITTSSSSTTSVTASGFALGSAIAKGGFQFGSVPKMPSGAQDAKSEASKLTTSESVSRTENVTFSPVFGGGNPSNSFALGAAPPMVTGSVSSLTTGGFQFQGPTSSSKDSTASPFATSLPSSSSSTVPASDSLKSDGAVSKTSSLSKDFSFTPPAKPSSDAASKPGLFASAVADSAKKNGVNASSSSASQGFVFGAASSAGSLPTNLFSSVPQLSSGNFTAAKPPVNGEVGAPPPFSFGQPSASTSAAAGGFAFGASLGNKDISSTNSSLTSSTKSFTFGTDAAAVGKQAPEKRHLDNDVGPTNAKKRVGLTGSSSTGESEGFKFGSTAPGTGNDLFKFSQTSQGGQDKTAGLSAFGGQASGFGGSSQGGFSFSLQSNAASSTGVQQAASVFGAGAGTGQFPFGVASNAQSNAAAASPFGSEAPTPSQGFSFSGATQPSFSFGANNTNTPASVFQFGSSTGEPAPAAGGGLFVFGQSAPSADTSAPPSAFSASNPAGFGAAPAQNFNIGTGDGPRKIKRAVRRTARK